MSDTPQPDDNRQQSAHDKHRERERRRNAEASESGRDIGEIPPVENPERRALAEQSFRLFCESYLPQTFRLAWSEDHLKVIAKIETAVTLGGTFAVAMPRGSGKTSLCEAAALWAILTGRRKFVALVGAEEQGALEMLASLKIELETNELLLADFPEAVFPVWQLEGIVQRSRGQLYKGERTHIGWNGKRLILPTIPGSQASGAIVRVAGITGRVRGMKHKRPDGNSARPDLAIVDDPQTDESAKNPDQCAKRARLVTGAILGLAGPDTKIACAMPCTVIRSGDLADQFLDRKLHPEWQGERTKLIYSFPTATAPWDEYFEIRKSSFAAGNHGRESTAFYGERRAEMDAGALVAWPARHNPDELSAVQHAMNLRADNPETFWAEYQNEPRDHQADAQAPLTAEQVAGKQNGYTRSQVPANCEHLTAFIDVQARLLYYVVMAWEESFSGYVLDYGTCPEQPLDYFAYRDANPTLAAISPGAGEEGQIVAGLKMLTMQLLSRDWIRADGARMRITRCVVDRGWKPTLITEFCRQSPMAAALTPSIGHGVKAKEKPLTDGAPKAGERRGLAWMQPAIARHEGRDVRHVTYDTNFWKSFSHARLRVAEADRGCVSLFRASSYEHRMLADHLTSEAPTVVESKGRRVEEWTLKPGLSDNHWFDCFVGNHVAASMCGCSLSELPAGKGKPRPKLKLSEIYERKRQEREGR
jgi:phage terminase large subunit GpA